MNTHEFSQISLSAEQIEAVVERARAARAAYLGQLLRKFPTLFKGLTADWSSTGADRRMRLNAATKF